MAIPNNYIDKIKDKDSGESRPICPPAEHVSVDNENFEGETLDEVLDEVAQAIEDAGQGGYAPPAGGIPKTDLAQSVQDSLDAADSAVQTVTINGETVRPSEGNVNLGTIVGEKGDKGDKGDTGAQGPKGDTGATGAQGPKGDTGATGAQGPKGDTGAQGETGATGPQGPKGDKGDKGDTVVLDPSQVEQFDIINSLNAQAAGNALDAYQGARLKAQIDCVYARLQAVYAALGNIAFWDGKPASATILPNLDWGLPKHTLTLDLTLSNASVKVNGTAYANGDTLSVEEYATLSVLIEPSADHLFNTAPTLTFGGQSVTLTANQDGSYSADVVMGQADATMAASATGVASYSISYGTLSHCSTTTAPTSIISGNQATIVFGVDSGYRLAQSGISVTNASIVSYDASTGTLVIGNATGNVTISATATVAPLKFVKGYYIDVDYETFTNTAISVDSVNIVPNFLASDYIKLPQTQSLTSLAIYWGFNRKNQNPNPAPLALFVRENGQYKLVYKRASSGTATYKSGLQTEVNAVAEAVTAMQAGELYARVLHYTTDGTTMNSDCKLVWNGTNITHSGMSYEIVTDPTEIEDFVKSSSALQS